MRRLALALILSLSLATLAQAKPPTRLAPPVFCTMANRMDVFIDEDDIMWECACEALRSGHICAWQVVGGVDSVAVRKFKRKHKRVIVFYARPSVVA